MNWAYGVRTTSRRQQDLLPQTLNSLAKAGFPEPHLFIDGALDGGEWTRNSWSRSITSHYPAVGIFANWLLSAWELFFRNPHADRYALFEDDILACKNLRQYLETRPYPNMGYCNLYIWPDSENKTPSSSERVWFPSNQKGQGGQALMFDRSTLVSLLRSHQFVEQATGDPNMIPNIDGGIIVAAKRLGWKEYIHYPSLIQHVGTSSTIGHEEFPQTPSFPGEDFDCLELVT